MEFCSPPRERKRWPRRSLFSRARSNSSSEEAARATFAAFQKERAAKLKEELADLEKALCDLKEELATPELQPLSPDDLAEHARLTAFIGNAKIKFREDKRAAFAAALDGLTAAGARAKRTELEALWADKEEAVSLDCLPQANALVLLGARRDAHAQALARLNTLTKNRDDQRDLIRANNAEVHPSRSASLVPSRKTGSRPAGKTGPARQEKQGESSWEGEI